MTLKVHSVGQLFGHVLRPQNMKGLNFGDIFLKIALKLRQNCNKVEIKKSKQLVNCQI